MNRLISSGMLKDVQDPTETFVVPKTLSEVPAVDFAPLQKALNRVRESSKAFAESTQGRALAPSSQANLDKLLFQTERALTRTEGLPRRDWFRHQIYAPGFYTGYGVKTLPGIREAIEQRDWNEAREQIAIAAGVLERFADQIDRARKLN